MYELCRVYFSILRRTIVRRHTSVDFSLHVDSPSQHEKVGRSLRRDYIVLYFMFFHWTAIRSDCHSVFELQFIFRHFMEFKIHQLFSIFEFFFGGTIEILTLGRSAHNITTQF